MDNMTKNIFNINQTDPDGNTPLHRAVKHGQETDIEYLINNGADVEKANRNGQTPLHLAASLGCLKATKVILSRGANMDTKDKDGYSVLHSAAQYGHLDVTEYLIIKGAEVNRGDNHGSTALHVAVHYGHLDVTKYLISRGAEVNKENNDGWTALMHSAAQEGNLNITKYLISEEAEIKRGTDNGWTALHSAARTGQLDVTKYLISHGAEVNRENDGGRTALKVAAQEGHRDVTEYLISKGADVNMRDNDGRSALKVATQEGPLDVVKYLISQGAEVNRGKDMDRTSLQVAAQKGHLAVTEYIISQGAEVNTKIDDGWTALMPSAAQKGHPDYTKYLDINQRAEMNRRTDNSWTVLHSFARYGKLDVIKYLISQGAEVNRRNDDGKTALHSAVRYGHVDVTEYLVSQGADLITGDNHGSTALHVAAQEGHLDFNRYLISQGSDMNKGDNNGRTALHSAAGYGHLDVTEYLISQGAEVNKADNTGSTSLYVAAQEGRLDVIKYVISQGAEVNRGADNGLTALHSAARTGQLKVTDYLIIQGAEVNRGDNHGSTALHVAVHYGHLDVTENLISRGAEVNKSNNEGWTALMHSAAQEGHLDITKYLISQGAEVNRGTDNGWTALHSAALYGQLNVSKYLIRQGAEVNRGNDGGTTALHVAAREGRLDITKYLISQRGDVNKGDNDGRTALHTAAHYGNLDVIKHLISQGAELKRGTNNGSTALHSAARYGQVDVAKCLISQGAEVNRGDNNGRAALHSAVQNGHLGVTKYLISQGAKVNKGDNDGRNALHIAAHNGCLDVTKYLLTRRKSVNMVDRNGYTPLHIAAMNDDLHIVEVLLEKGAQIDVKDNNGQTPLHLSSTKGSANSSDILAKHAKINGILDDSDDEGLTAIHLATQNGRTSIVESLVYHGASLNIQSHDGKTCLHEAIIQFDRKVREGQTKARPQQISEDFYQPDFFPKKDLVLYLLEHGANLDIRDGKGKLPIHYASNEVIRQVIFSRLPSIEMITRYRAEEAIPLVTVSVHVDNGRKQIELEDLGISMSIPPGAVQENSPCEITLTSIQDPPSMNSQGDESLACFGIRCDPPNMIFHQPVKIRIPHSVFIVNPDQVKADIVCRVWDSAKDLPRTLRKGSSSSPEEPPYCRVYRKHLELYIGHCAEWWVLIPLEQQVIRRQLMCTPYIPETIERGKEIEVHVHVHADVPGMDTKVLHEEKHQSYRKAHRPVPFSIISHSGDVTVARDCEGKTAETKLSLKAIHNRMRHNVVFNLPPSEDVTPYEVITVTITQSGNLGVSRSMAFVIRYEDEIESPEFTQVIREIEGTSRNDFPDIKVQKIAEKLSIDDFYDLGVALGFQRQQLDAIEYKRLKDRQLEAICEMLIKWKQRQLPHQNVKGMLLSILKSAETETEKTNMTDTTSTGDISDQALLKLARQIKWTDFIEIGTKLGFSRNKLENIMHKTLKNRKDANIQMLCMWKASQRSVPKVTKTLECIWESISLASAEYTDESLRMISSATPEKRAKPSEPIEPEDMDIITTSDTERGEINDDLDQYGGTPNIEELCSVAQPVKSLPLACSLGKALRLNDDVIIGSFHLPSSSVLHKIARQLVDSWWNGLKEESKEHKFAKLLSEYKTTDFKTVSTGRGEISKAIGSKTDLLDLCHRLSVEPSRVLQIMSRFVTFPPHMIGRSTLKMLKEWVHEGGTRERLLEIAQAFRFNDAAVKIAEAMKCQPNYKHFISHGIIDHKGGELTLDELGIAVSIPEGAMPKGMRSVVTLRVPTHDTPRLPVREGEVVITPVIEGSLTQELLKPATVVLPHCTNYHELTAHSPVILCTRTGPGTFGRRNLTPRTSHILKDKIKFRTRHLQVWALSSTNLQGLQLRCVIFQPLVITPAEKPSLRVYIFHPYRNYIEDITRREKTSSVPYCQVLKELRFSIETTAKDLKIVFHEGTKSNTRIMPIKDLLSGKCSPVNYKLKFSPEEKGKKNVHINILQGSATLAGRTYILSIEDEPDYTVDHTYSQGRLQYVSNNLLEILQDVIPSPKDLKSLGYQLGFSNLAIEKYLSRPDSSCDCVSRSGFGEMLRDWRRKVRPSEQEHELYLSLQNAGLGDTAEVILPKPSNRRCFAQVRQALESEKVTTESDAEKNNCDNLPGKAQSDRTYSVKPINNALDDSSATGNFGAIGGELSTKSHGFTLCIPPGALEKDEQISIQVLTEIPEGLTLKDDEFLVSHGFQCYPSGLRFKKPAKLIIPHCAIVTTPNKVKTILYSWNRSGTPIRLPDSSNFICSVQERCLEVSVSHFCGGFFALIWDWLFPKAILLSCMSFLPKILPDSRKPVLEVQFVKKPHDQKRKDLCSQPVKGDDDEIVFLQGTLTVACQLGEKSPKSDVHAIQFSDMRSKKKVTEYFELDLTEESDETLVTLEVLQNSTQTIKFNTRFQGIGNETTEQNALSPIIDKISSDKQKVTDADILKLSKLLSPDQWSELYVALRIDYSAAECIRKEFRKISEQYIHLLQIWKAASTRTRKDLNAILVQIDAGGLVNKYV